MVEGSAEELVEVLKTVVAGIELELVLSVAPAAAAAAERKAAGAVADEDAPEVGTAGVGAVLNGKTDSTTLEIITKSCDVVVRQSY